MSTLVGIASLNNRDPAIENPYDDLNSLGDCVHQALLQSGLGKENPQIPLLDIVRPGTTVLVKPNWVLDRHETGGDITCLITNPAIVVAIVKETIAAKPGKIIIGDAPIQGCKWDAIVTSEFLQAIDDLRSPFPIECIDFRRTVLKAQSLANSVESNIRPENDYVLFDLGCESMLEPVSNKKCAFRVTMYDPRLLSKRHYKGKHQYLLCKESLEANTIINIPKVKFHKKAGLTGALKNLVGLNGNKEFLPHHRLGGTATGGDCYPGLAPMKMAAEWCLDRANKSIGTPAYKKWLSRAQRTLSWHKRIFGEAEIEGGWYGNDTIWRTVIDLNRIALYGKSDGTLNDYPQRRIWTISDAIICGDREGPLAPNPLFIGAVCSSSSSVAADIVHAALLRLNPHSIPLLREARSEFKWPLIPIESMIEVRYNNGIFSIEKIRDTIGVPCCPSQGWKGHCEDRSNDH